MCISHHTSLIRLIKRVPKRQGLCRLHCKELTVIWGNCCTPTDTTCTASYMRAASVWKASKKEIWNQYNMWNPWWAIWKWREGRGERNMYPVFLHIREKTVSLHALVFLDKILWSNYYTSSVRTFDGPFLPGSDNPILYCLVSLLMLEMCEDIHYSISVTTSVSVLLFHYTDTHTVNATANILKNVYKKLHIVCQNK